MGNVSMIDYSRLKGRIIEKFGTNQAFSDAMGWSLGTNGKKTTGKAAWSQDEIFRACDLLSIEHAEILLYFFTLKC